MKYILKNDLGPFKKGQILDVTAKVAKQLKEKEKEMSKKK